MIGTQLGAYRILEKLGEGGMGAVYRARDTKLNRDVALKFLPIALAADPDRLARFRREAQVLAALNHPNIAQIYGLEDSGEAPVLVMEIVSGRTLDDVIRSGPMAWDDVVPIARQIAEALENAHERGIVHRDLKPANVKLREDGTIKVLDFGLAKALGSGGDSGSDPGQRRTGALGPDSAPTVTSPAALTEAGLILGTATYMAPEQAKGRAVDKRADIWAYGAVVFELLTGQRLFAGESVTETIAAVIKDDLQLDRLPPDLPPSIRALIERCLVRDPSRRLRDIGEARILFSGEIDSAEPKGSALQINGSARQLDSSVRQARRRNWLLTTAGAIALVITAGFVGWSIKGVPDAPPLRRLDLEMPASVGDFALSRDGNRLAYVTGGRLYVRRFDELDAREIARVHITAGLLTWSPDDRTIAFTAEASLRSVPADGGPILDICRIPASGRVMGLGWQSDGRLLFTVWRDSLYVVAAGGGTPAVHVAIDPATEVDFHHLSVLPDNRLIVATHKRKDDSDVIELITPGGARTPLTDDRTVSKFEYLDPGRLVFRRTTTNAGVWSIPFRDGAIDVAQAALVQAGATDYRLGRDGTIVAFFPARVRESLVWVDEKGVETAVPGDAVDSPDRNVEISPDGRRAVYAVGTWSVTTGGAAALNNATIVVRDLATGVDLRLVGGPAASGMWEDTGSPTWSADGQRIVHRTGGVENVSLVERPAHVAGGARTLAQGFLGRLMPDGQTLIFSRDVRGAGVIESAAIAPDGQIGSVRRLFSDESQPNAHEFDLSGDGSLITYVARQPNQRADVFLARTANPAQRWLIQEGGNHPRLSVDGSQLFFTRGATDTQGNRLGEIVKVSIAAGPAMTIGRPVVVIRETPGGPWITSFDVSPDGRRLLMWKPLPVAPGEGERYVLVENALRR